MIRSRHRSAQKVAGLRRVRRPATDLAPAFDLAYVREAPGIGPVVLEIPGGPGIAVPLPYRGFRRRARLVGLDMIMVEHRGIGLSRKDASGEDLPATAMSVRQVVDDLLAVLDAEGIERAIISGASYGSYVAAAFAVTHPERVAGLVLDSPVLGAEDYRAVRGHARALLWRGDAVDSTPETRRIAAKIRTLVERDGHDPERLGAAVLVLFERGGPAVTEQYLDQLVQGRAPATTAVLSMLTGGDALGEVAHLFEGDLVAHISHGELHYSSPVDGLIFDPGSLLGRADAPAFRGDPVDFPAQLASVEAPAVVLVGDRDTQTPLPSARAAAEALPDATLVVLPEHGHSALDSRPAVLLLLLKALARGTHRRLGALSGSLAERTAVAMSARLHALGLRALLAVDRVIAPVPRRPRGLR